jgi:hypothetical protein
MKLYGKILTPEEAEIQKRTKISISSRKYPGSPKYGHTKAEHATYQRWYAKNRKKPTQSKHKKNYDAPKKNEFRGQVIKTFPKFGRCLTLDGRQELFSKATPYLKHTIYEYKRVEFRAMQENPRRNVEVLRNKDVVDAPIYDPNLKPNCAFVDWMGTFYTHKEDLERLAPYLDSCKAIAFSFSMWGGHLSIDRKKNVYDYKMEVVGRLMNIFKNFKYKLSMPYCDTSPMVGIILVKRNAPTEDVVDVFAGDISEKQISKIAVRSTNLSIAD